MKPSILRNLLLSSVAFGLVMGGMFPLFSNLFVDFKEGMLGWFVGGCLVAGAGLGVANYWLVNMILLTRLKRISEVANAISQNDISHHCNMQSDDLIGEIVSSFNRMAENLRNVIGEISGATTQLASAAEEMSAVTDEASRGVQHQHTEIEHVATAMNEMTSTVQEVAHNAALAAQSAQQADSGPRRACGSRPHVVGHSRSD